MSFLPTFQALKTILQQYASDLSVKQDTETNYTLETVPNDQFPKGEFFGSVQIKKNYVSYYLMPIYCNPNLATDLTPELQRRKQGKSCFNFKKEDTELMRQLAELTAKGLADYRAAGKV